MRSMPLGSWVGVAGGLVFVLANAGNVPGGLWWRVAAVLAAVAIVGGAVARQVPVAAVEPSRSATRTYGLAVVGMLIAIPAGAAVISQVLDAPDAVPIWVVAVVGAHFGPFARAFGLPMFRWLTLSMVAVAAVGALATPKFATATAAGWTGVVAGFVLLGFSALGTTTTSATGHANGP